MSAKIVVVEDEEDILELIEYNLAKEGYEVIGFLNTKNLQQLLYEERIDLLLMDRNLPNVEGSEFISLLREKGFTTPVIYLSAKSLDSEIEEGFLRGGDDYITKPFNMRELLLRIKALLRRTTRNVEDTILSHRDLVLENRERTLKIDGKNVDITKLEFELLSEFIFNKNIVLDREYLLEHVWDGAEDYQYQTVNVAINRLKEKIDPDKTKEYIQAVRGVGYKLC
ncbi:two component transcriptional regulator, winged helix family [Sulfurimonas denitrificans DSM 1251]|uniref:Two component transcriptional regulator, winged helix family n=1 Tax=Sulfurimonas denitrificans (strain ATCC 33889 / DSM 1251) TaxID=326298 RepID=Q30Q95_SULDN|nr:response regulator transcription factor [Sulfurimonas denitrificans]ABB44836.1 two component transcriptional regulator, winged helix family [Sulfurimonas denitrificans DSM 1251]MDD3443266.1 response regulator transcription factor [Sulfurimonas denitrificans]